ncbi:MULTISPECIES: GFA family protein [Ramlibacter]|uniref:GFA family protein n=1 Tax=Ramlibacter aquaticus TaxID=2780094 RepID=A0ABR9SJW4_9BURK|nr:MULTISPECIES: GFA family protein [Ramlibacter]MBE7942588.1 GFA family protein [Ramlibacter aquaticus]
MLRGSCLCQGVAFEISGEVTGLLYCHCRMCRKAHGTAFRARGAVKAAELHWTRGEALVRYFESSPGTHRGFCSVCGSSLVSRFDDEPGVLGLALGALDDDPGARPACHVHVASKAPWHEITDRLPRHEDGLA